MKTNSIPKEDAEAISPESVVSFLREHPDFLCDHDDLLALLTVRHPDHGAVISLTERQLQLLRDRIDYLECSFMEVMIWGADNNKISAAVQRLSVALIEARGAEQVGEVIVRSVKEFFHLSFAAVTLWQGEGAVEVDKALQTRVQALLKPWCGKPVVGDFLELFSAHAEVPASAAILPIAKQGKAFGVLALCSDDPEHFSEEIGTFFLEQIAELVGAALGRDM